MSELLEKIDEIVPSGYNKRHSFFQLQYYVIGKEPTVQARQQACRDELFARKCDMEGSMNELEECYDLIRLQEIQIEEIKAGQDQLDEIDEIRIRQIRRKIKSMEERVHRAKGHLKAKEEESNFLIGLYQRLCELEEPKDWDSLEVQAEYQNARLSRELETRLLLGQTPDTELFKTIMALPEGMPAKKATQQLIEKGKEHVRSASEDVDKIEQQDAK